MLLVNILGCSLVDMAIADVEWLLGYDSTPSQSARTTILPAPYDVFDPLTTEVDRYDLREQGSPQEHLTLYKQELLFKKVDVWFDIIEQDILFPQGFREQSSSSTRRGQRHYSDGKKSWYLSGGRERDTVRLCMSPTRFVDCSLWIQL